MASAPTALIASHRHFTHIWPFAADELLRLFSEHADARHLADPAEQPRPVQDVAADQGVPLERVERLVALASPVDPGTIEAMPALRELAVRMPYWDGADDDLKAACQQRGVRLIDDFKGGAAWGQSVAEFGLALTLCALRQIPQKHAAITRTQDPWETELLETLPGSHAGGHQFGDHPTFVSGTLQGKRVRVAGLGNIGGRYARFCADLGAHVVAWDPMAPQAQFDLAHARRVQDLASLAHDADIFAPTLPLLKPTEGLITADVIDAIPDHAIFIAVTRMAVCDEAALRRRVLNDELVLASDVFDPHEPLPLDDPLLGRSNVIHTPHIAGRTRDANHAWARLLHAHFTT
jgi:phosphoglycerate dehydrogenase-like enzyme